MAPQVWAGGSFSWLPGMYGDESHPTARCAGLCPATVTPCGLGGPLRARPPFLCPSWRRVGVPTGGPRGVAVSHRLPAACPLQACRSPLRAGIGAPAQSPSASASLEEVPDVPALKGRRGCPAAALGCAPGRAWSAGDRSPPGSLPFGAQSLWSMLGGCWRGRQQSSSVGGWLSAAGTRVGGAVSWLENRGGQFSPREGLRPTESHSFRVPQLFSHSDGKEAWPGERAWPKVTGKAEPGPWRADGGSGRGQGHQHGRH